MLLPACSVLAGNGCEQRGTTGTGKITRLLNLSAAHLQGILAVGDEIVEVNGRKCDAASLKKALECNDNLFGSSVLLTCGRSCVIALPRTFFCLFFGSMSSTYTFA